MSVNTHADTPGNEVLTVEEAASLLRISRGTAYEAVRTGAIPSCRLGRRILIPRAALLAHLRAAVEPDAPAALKVAPDPER